MLTFLYIVLTLTSVLLGAVILIQDSKAGGLAGAFGGAGGGESIIGTSGAKQISKFTAIVSAVFFVLCIMVGVMRQNEAGTSVLKGKDEAETIGADAGGATSDTDPLVNILNPTAGNGTPITVTPGSGTTVTVPGTQPGTTDKPVIEDTGTAPPPPDGAPKTNDATKPPAGETPPGNGG